jgi:hypothetical protein
MGGVVNGGKIPVVFRVRESTGFGGNVVYAEGETPMRLEYPWMQMHVPVSREEMRDLARLVVESRFLRQPAFLFALWCADGTDEWIRITAGSRSRSTYNYLYNNEAFWRLRARLLSLAGKNFETATWQRKMALRACREVDGASDTEAAWGAVWTVRHLTQIHWELRTEDPDEHIQEFRFLRAVEQGRLPKTEVLEWCRRRVETFVAEDSPFYREATDESEWAHRMEEEGRFDESFFSSPDDEAE